MNEETDWYSADVATFGDRIAAAREILGLGQSELSERLGIRVETLRGWEEDRTEPRANRLQMMAGVLNVSLRWLLTGEGEGLRPPTDNERVEFTSLAAEMRELRADMARTSDRLARLERRLAELAKAEA